MLFIALNGKDMFDLTSLDRSSHMIELPGGTHTIVVYVKSCKKINVRFKIELCRNAQIEIDTRARFSVRLEPIVMGATLLEKEYNVLF